MIQFHQEYLVDEEDNRKAVVPPTAAWEQILEVLEEHEYIRAYDDAKNHPSKIIPFDQAVSELAEVTRD